MWRVCLRALALVNMLPISSACMRYSFQCVSDHGSMLLFVACMQITRGQRLPSKGYTTSTKHSYAANAGHTATASGSYRPASARQARVSSGAADGTARPSTARQARVTSGSAASARQARVSSGSSRTSGVAASRGSRQGSWERRPAAAATTANIAAAAATPAGTAVNAAGPAGHSSSSSTSRGRTGTRSPIMRQQGSYTATLIRQVAESLCVAKQSVSQSHSHVATQADACSSASQSMQLQAGACSSEPARAAPTVTTTAHHVAAAAANVPAAAHTAATAATTHVPAAAAQGSSAATAHHVATDSASASAHESTDMTLAPWAQARAGQVGPRRSTGVGAVETLRDGKARLPVSAPHYKALGSAHDKDAFAFGHVAENTATAAVHSGATTTSHNTTTAPGPTQVGDQ